MKIVEKIRNSKPARFITAAATAVIAGLNSAIIALAAEGDAGEEAMAGINTIFTTIKAEYTVTRIAAILSVALLSAVALVLFWFGARKTLKIISRALFKGKLAI